MNSYQEDVSKRGSGKTRAPRVSTLMNVADVLGYRIEWHKL
jgi:hypothetical protein